MEIFFRCAWTKLVNFECACKSSDRFMEGPWNQCFKRDYGWGLMDGMFQEGLRLGFDGWKAADVWINDLMGKTNLNSITAGGISSSSRNNNNIFHLQGGQGWNRSRSYCQRGNGNSNSFNSSQPSLRDLGFSQAKINKSLTKKLAPNNKPIETIHAKMDGISSTIKNYLSFNKMLETQLAQLAIAFPSTEIGKILGQPEPSLENVNSLTTRRQDHSWSTIS